MTSTDATTEENQRLSQLESTLGRLTRNYKEMGCSVRMFSIHIPPNIAEHPTINTLESIVQAVEQQQNDIFKFYEEQQIKWEQTHDAGFTDYNARQIILNQDQPKCERIARTIELYLCDLGKTFEQFRRDYESTGFSFQNLHKISDIYSEFIEESKLKSVINYVAKQRNRDLIDGLTKFVAKKSLIQQALEKLDPASNKKQYVQVLSALNDTYRFLCGIYYHFGEEISGHLSNLNASSSAEEVIHTIKQAKHRFYEKVLGEGYEIPEQIQALVDNVVTCYFNRGGLDELKHQETNIQNALKVIMEAYVQGGAIKSLNAVKKLSGNQKVRELLKSRGVNIDAFENGIQRTYHVKTDEDQERRVRTRIESEFQIIYNRLSNVNIPVGDIDKIKNSDWLQQLRSIEELLGQYQFDEQTKPLKKEIKGHIQTIKSMGGTTKEIEDDVDFYVSQNPLESLHMGQYFSSCLSLAKNHGGVNGWVAVVQTTDSNKNVIYARDSNGNYVGRNRTALTDQGVLCTRFHQNGNLFLEDAWIEYLTDFGKEVQLDVIIPAMFVSPIMKEKLESLKEDGNVLLESREIRIAPAHFSTFYGDGLLTQRSENGEIKINTEVYVISHC